MQILGSAFTEGARNELPPFLQQLRPTFPIGWDENATALAYLQVSFMSQGYVPKMVFIDRGGTIRAQYTGEDAFFQGDTNKAIRAKLDEMLKAAPAPVKKARTAKKGG